MTMSDGSVMTMNGISMSNLKNNSSYVKEVKILNVNTKIEINPFHSGFNTFKITFTLNSLKSPQEFIRFVEDT